MPRLAESTQRRNRSRTKLGGEIYSLPADHPAMINSKTMYPKSVAFDLSNRLLVSGKHNKKLGKRVRGGQFDGYELYQLTLEERATCPDHCSLLGKCYGNAMPFARRNNIGNEGSLLRLCAYGKMEKEIKDVLSKHTGMLVRLHVLGDFPDMEYVHFWDDMLEKYDKLACFGYTHWKQDEPMGKHITCLKEQYDRRFAIRWSDYLGGDSAHTFSNKVHVPGLPIKICPAQLQDDKYCANCGYCWNTTHPIGFIEHGKFVKGTRK